jgi:hypothetical protein
MLIIIIIITMYQLKEGNSFKNNLSLPAFLEINGHPIVFNCFYLNCFLEIDGHPIVFSLTIIILLFFLNYNNFRLV